MCTAPIVSHAVTSAAATAAAAINLAQGATENDRMIQYKILIYCNEELGMHPIGSNRNTISVLINVMS